MKRPVQLQVVKRLSTSKKRAVGTYSRGSARHEPRAIMASADFLRITMNVDGPSEQIFDRARAEPVIEVPRRKDARGNGSAAIVRHRRGGACCARAARTSSYPNERINCSTRKGDSPTCSPSIMQVPRVDKSSLQAGVQSSSFRQAETIHMSPEAASAWLSM